MGEDKAWLLLDGRPLVARALAAARPAVDRLAVVVSPGSPHLERYRELADRWDARLLPDPHDYRGPLGGIHTALADCAPGEAALVLACDLPFVTPGLLSLLRRLHETASGLVTVPRDESGRLQPLAAVYAADCLAPVAAMLAAGELKADRLLTRVAAREVAFSELAGLPGSARFFVNLNTPQDYRDARGQEESRRDEECSVSE